MNSDHTIAVGVAGFITVDTIHGGIAGGFAFGGTFNINLYDSIRGQFLYLREGKYYLPWLAP